MAPCDSIAPISNSPRIVVADVLAFKLIIFVHVLLASEPKTYIPIILA